MTKNYIFDPQDLQQLLVHYSDGAIPLNGVVTNVGVSALLQRVVMLEIESDEWDDDTPIHLRYDHHQRMATWKQEGGEMMDFQKRNDTPRVQ